MCNIWNVYISSPPVIKHTSVADEQLKMLKNGRNSADTVTVNSHSGRC